MTTVEFECKTEKITVWLETEVKPVVGEMVSVNGNEYIIKKIIWILENSPAQSIIKAEIERAE